MTLTILYGTAALLSLIGLLESFFFRKLPRALGGLSLVATGMALYFLAEKAGILFIIFLAASLVLDKASQRQKTKSLAGIRLAAAIVVIAIATLQPDYFLPLLIVSLSLATPELPDSRKELRRT